MPEQNGRHFLDNIFKWIFIRISLEFIPKVTIVTKSALRQVMAWHQIGNKPLTEVIMKQWWPGFLTHMRLQV